MARTSAKHNHDDILEAVIAVGNNGVLAEQLIAATRAVSAFAGDAEKAKAAYEVAASKHRQAVAKSRAILNATIGAEFGELEPGAPTAATVQTFDGYAVGSTLTVSDAVASEIAGKTLTLYGHGHWAEDAEPTTTAYTLEEVKQLLPGVDVRAMITAPTA